jgi:hypothetical protein
MTGLPVEQNRPVYRGDTVYFRTINIEIDGVAADLSGDSFAMRIVEKASGVVFFDMTQGNGITVTANSVKRRLGPAQTANMVPGKKYVFDFEWTRATGDVHTLEHGEISVTKDITP